MTGRPPPDRALRSRRVATPEGIRPAAIVVSGGAIAAVVEPDDLPAGVPLVDVGDAVIFPGLVDTHVHVNEPGRTEWEGFATATRAAAAGGVTTLLDMPLNAIPATTSVASLEVKRAAARGRCAVDVGFLGGVVPGNSADIGPLVDAGVFAFKCFLVDSGVPEFPPVTEADLRAALPVLAARDALLMVHAELPGPIARASPAPAAPRARYGTWRSARPAEAEVEAVRLLARLAGEFAARIHVVHVSAAGSIPVLAEARSRGVRISAETCPHYLFFAGAEIADGATEFKCAPPIRDARDRDRLWAGLLAGTLDLVVSDHSPSPPALKCREAGDFLEAWGGIASLELGLSVVGTAARARGVALERVAEWMSAAPARLFGLDRSKGAIAVGRDADLVVWRPEEELVVEAASLRQRHPGTPYLGRRLAGRVRATYLRGVPVYRAGEPDAAPVGRLLRTQGR